MGSTGSAIAAPAALRWFIYLPILIGLAILTSLVGYGYYTGSRLNELESPLLNIVHEIKLESGITRFWIEEALDGEEPLDHDLAWGHLEQAVVYLKSLAEGERASLSKLSESGVAGLGFSIERLSSALAAWKAISERIADPQRAPATADFRVELNNAFVGFLSAVSDIETKTQAELENRKSQFRSIQAVLIGACILLAAGATAAARRYEREKSRSILQLTEANRMLQEEICRREIIEATLSERERLLSKIFNDSPVSIIVTLLSDMRIVEVNDWFLAVTGFEKEEILKRPFHDVVICSDPLGKEKFGQTLVEQKQVRNLQCELPVKTGPARTVLLSTTLIDLGGEAHILSAARDITDYKTAQKTLMQSEQKFRSLIESAPDLILLADPRGKILLANSAASQRLGYAADEIAGRCLVDFLSPEYREHFAAQLPGLLNQGSLRAEYDLVGRKGEIIPVDCSATTVEIGSEGAFTLIFQKDITDRRKNEAAFRAVHRFLIAANRHQELQAMLEDFLDVILDTTASDAAAVRVEDGSLGRPSIAARGFDLQSCRPDRNPDSRLCAHLLKYGAGGGESGFTPSGSFYCNSVDCSLEMGDGKVGCPVHRVCGQPSFESFALVPVQGPAGRVGLIHIAYRASNRVTDESIRLLEAAALQLGTAIQRVRAEEALKCSHNELERRVLERTEELSIINERLKAEVLERSLTERSLVQHQEQLRKLSSVLVQTEEHERHRIATAIHDGVGQTLAAAKIKLGALKPKIAPELWDGQLGDVRGLISLAIEETRSLTFELSPPVLYEIGLQAALEWMAERFQHKFGLPVRVGGDGCDRKLSIPHRVFAFQAVRELCLNVAKHARATLVVVAVVEDGGCVRIEVADDGSGFEANRSRKVGDGMGFGLFSIREQLRHYGGTLAIDPLPGKGTRVTLRMPVASPPEA